MHRTLKAFRIEQGEREMLLFSIPAKDLIRISYYNPREFDRETGIQRGFDPKRSKEIARYIESEDAVLPNNIIVNLELDRLRLTIEDVFNERDSILNLSAMVEKANLLKANNRLRGKVKMGVRSIFLA